MRVAAAGGALLAIVVGLGVLAFARGEPTTPPGPAETVKALLDRRDDLGRRAAFLRDFDRNAIYYATEPDRIRAIDRPAFDTPEQASRFLGPTDLVIGIEHRGEAHAYPVNLLAVHEIVNDVVGGVPVAVTWCPLCRTATAFERRIGGRTLLFGVSGLLYRGNLIMFDRTTGSLWSQLLGGAITGPLRGTSLRSLPLLHETWASWRRRHPSAPVLSIARDSEAQRFTRPWSEETAFGPELSNVPFAAYATKVPYVFRKRVRGLADAALVVGLVVRGEARAYPLVQLRRARIRETVIGGEPVLLVHGDDDALWASAYSRRLGDRVLSFRLRAGSLVDTESGSRWSLTSGRATSGPLAGRSLRRLPSTTSYWFAWRGLHPRTRLVTDE
jgi:hypothetical protein